MGRDEEESSGSNETSSDYSSGNDCGDDDSSLDDERVRPVQIPVTAAYDAAACSESIVPEQNHVLFVGVTDAMLGTLLEVVSAFEDRYVPHGNGTNADGRLLGPRAGYHTVMAEAIRARGQMTCDMLTLTYLRGQPYAWFTSTFERLDAEVDLGFVSTWAFCSIFHVALAHGAFVEVAALADPLSGGSDLFVRCPLVDTRVCAVLRSHCVPEHIFARKVDPDATCDRLWRARRAPKHCGPIFFARPRGADGLAAARRTALKCVPAQWRESVGTRALARVARVLQGHCGATMRLDDDMVRVDDCDDDDDAKRVAGCLGSLLAGRLSPALQERWDVSLLATTEEP